MQALLPRSGRMLVLFTSLHSKVYTEDTHEPSSYSVEEMDSAHFDEPMAQASADHERSKLYNKALFLLKLKEEQRLLQLTVNSLIGDISTLLEE